MFRSVRVLLAWLLLVALPLQGFAAGRMLFCGSPSAGAATVLQDVAGTTSAHGVLNAAGVSEVHAHHGHERDAQPSSAKSGGESAHHGSIDAGHRCPICATCNLAAIAVAHVSLMQGEAPAPTPAPLVERVSTRSTLVPDKPPRVRV